MQPNQELKKDDWILKKWGPRGKGYYPPVIYGHVDKSRECLILVPFVENQKTSERIHGGILAYAARAQEDGILFAIAEETLEVKRDIEYLNDLSYTNHVSSPFELKAGESVLFSVPREHLPKGIALRVKFSYEWEDPDVVFGGGEVEHIVSFSGSKLPQLKK